MRRKTKLSRLQRKKLVPKSTIKNRKLLNGGDRSNRKQTSRALILLRIIELIAAIAAILAVGFYAFYELPLIQSQRSMNAWSILDSENASAEAKGKAIEYLLRTDQSLRGVNLSSEKDNHLSLEGVKAKEISIRRLNFNNSRWLLEDTQSFNCWFCDLTNSQLYMKSGTLFMADSTMVGGTLAVDSADLGVSYSDLTDASIHKHLYGFSEAIETKTVSIAGSLISGLKTEGIIVEILNSYSLESNPPLVCSTGEPIKFISINENGSKYDFDNGGQNHFRDFIVSMRNLNRRSPWANDVIVNEVAPPIEYLEFVEKNCTER